jgi:hypothetical protein
VYLLRLGWCLATTNQPDTPPTFKSPKTPDSVIAREGLNVRDKLEKEMTPEQIADATKRAKVCMSSDYQDCE